MEGRNEEDKEMEEEDYDMIIDELAISGSQPYSMKPEPQWKYCEDDFEKIWVLGKGSYGKVFLVWLKVEGSKHFNKLFAMKVLKKEELFKKQ